MDDVKSDADNDFQYRENPQLTPQFPVNYRSDLEDEDESNNSVDSQKANDDENSNNGESSFESRGKRRKLNNFEFVPRNPIGRLISSSKTPIVKNSPPDWSEDSTFLLLEAWGDLFVKNGRKSLRSDEWSEVANQVNHNSKIIRSESQCRNRLDTLKKKYKKEKARMEGNVNFKSDWIYFEKMDSLMPSVFSTPVQAKKNVSSNMNMNMNSGSPLRLTCGVDAGEYVTANGKVYRNQGNAMDEMRDNPGDTSSESEDDDDEDDGLPPPTNIIRNNDNKMGSVSSLKILADSIKMFGEVYERIETKKREQMLQIEKMRREFCRDLEMQKREILERAQAEIARIREDEDSEDDKMVVDDNSDKLVDDDDDEDDEDEDVDVDLEENVSDY